MDLKSKQSTPGGRRDRRYLAMHERILAAAAACFAERGFAETTMDDIATRADVARATAFNHFGDKHQLLVAYFDRRRAWLFDQLDAVAADAQPVAAGLARVTDALARIYRLNPGEARATLDAWRRMPSPYDTGAAVADVFSAVIESGLASGEVDPRIDPRAAALTLFDACIGVVTRWLDSPDTDLAAGLGTALDVILRGISSAGRAAPAR